MLGREIMMPDEVRKMDNKKCLVFVRGMNPILDNKYIPFKHPRFLESADGSGEAYEHKPDLSGASPEPAFYIIGERSLEYYKKLSDKGEGVAIDVISYEDFMKLDNSGMEKRFMDMEQADDKAQYYEEEGLDVTYAENAEEEFKEGRMENLIPEEPEKDAEKNADADSKEDVDGNTVADMKCEAEDESGDEEAETVSYRITHMRFTMEQKAEGIRALNANIPQEYILNYFYPDTPVTKMAKFRRDYELKRESKQ